MVVNDGWYMLNNGLWLMMANFGYAYDLGNPSTWDQTKAWSPWSPWTQRPHWAPEPNHQAITSTVLGHFHNDLENTCATGKETLGKTPELDLQIRRKNWSLSECVYLSVHLSIHLYLESLYPFCNCSTTNLWVIWLASPFMYSCWSSHSPGPIEIPTQSTNLLQYLYHLPSSLHLKKKRMFLN